MTVFDGSPIPTHPGVDDQDVQPSKRLDCRLHHLLDGGELRHVRGHGQPLSPGSDSILHGLVEIRRRPRRATHRGSCPGIGLRDRLSRKELAA